jgi:hypothetical protein
VKADSLTLGGRRPERRGTAARARHARPAALVACLLLAACAPRLPRGEPPPEPEPVDTATARSPAIEPDTTVPAVPDTVPAAPRDTAPPTAAEPARATLRVCAGGDIMLGNNLDTLWAVRAAGRLGERVNPFPDPDSLLAPLRPLLAGAEVVLLNLEGAVGEGPAPAKCRPGSTHCYAFRQPVAAAAALARFAAPAVVVANMANNHAMDAGPEGFAATVAHLSEAGVYITGADTLPTLIPAPSGDTIAILGFSPFIAGPDPRDLDAVRRHVARAAARYRRLVVTMHMGAEGRAAQRTPDRNEIFLGEDRGNSVAFARAAAESGAALVVGHGPHVLRAAEWRGEALILYSLGNLLTYGPFNMEEPLNRGGIACAAVDSEGRVVEAQLRPTRQGPPGVASADPTGRGSFLVDSLSQIDFPETAGRVRDDGVVVGPAARR